jgi:uncharacterized protein YcaQ
MSDSASEQLSLDAARRIALAAQGFAGPRPSGPADACVVLRVIDRVGVLQLDSTNVLCRSHYLPVLGDRLVARVDLKADRPSSALLVRSADAEPGAGREVADELGAELRMLATWLELDRVLVAGPGNLGQALAQVRAVATGP